MDRFLCGIVYSLPISTLLLSVEFSNSLTPLFSLVSIFFTNTEQIRDLLVVFLCSYSMGLEEF